MFSELKYILCYRDVESCSHLLTSLDVCLSHLQNLLCWSEKGNLFANEEHRPDELFLKCGEIGQHCFYGRNLGFQVKIFEWHQRSCLKYFFISSTVNQLEMSCSLSAYQWLCFRKSITAKVCNHFYIKLRDHIGCVTIIIKCIFVFSGWSRWRVT